MGQLEDLASDLVVKSYLVAIQNYKQHHGIPDAVMCDRAAAVSVAHVENVLTIASTSESGLIGTARQHSTVNAAQRSNPDSGQPGRRANPCRTATHTAALTPEPGPSALRLSVCDATKASPAPGDKTPAGPQPANTASSRKASAAPAPVPGPCGIQPSSAAEAASTSHGISGAGKPGAHPPLWPGPAAQQYGSRSAEWQHSRTQAPTPKPAGTSYPCAPDHAPAPPTCGLQQPAPTAASAGYVASGSGTGQEGISTAGRAFGRQAQPGQQQPQQQQQQGRLWKRRAPPPPPPPPPPMLPWPLVAAAAGADAYDGPHGVWGGFGGGSGHAGAYGGALPQAYGWWPSGYGDGGDGGHEAYSGKDWAYEGQASYGPWRWQ
ncbi:hypothetical protein PLESTB_000182000 [Pleodorina starrii]|uniref:Uncharacterized protein n=1 Tax=Pleodorina starrii TaxID=330485 RepID=A0A9W6EYI0_9CHLO|nr:hypothetical protein PLESTB_000182000 [Pleodorina starrii]